MRRYTIEVIIEEGCDGFWEQLKGSGSDVVTEQVRLSVEEVFPSGDFQVKLSKYEVIDDQLKRIR